MAEEDKTKEKEKKTAMGSFNFYDVNLDNYERPSLTDALRPKNRNKAIDKAKEYVWTNGLLFRIIKLKVDLASAGLEPVHESEKIEKIYKDAYEKIDIHKFVKNFVYEYETVGEVFPYKTWEDGELTSLSLLNPKLTDVEVVFDKDMVSMKAPSGVRKMLNQYKRLSADEKKLLRKRVPADVLREWKKGKSVLLSDDNVSRYCNLKSDYEKRPKSPIEPIFNDLEIYRTLQEADYATAKKLKQLMLHVKVGSKDYNNGKAVDKKLIDATMDMFNNPSKNFEVFTQYFVNADYVTPDMDIFSKEKYENVISNIVNWSGVNVMVEQGGSYSQGFIKIKGLKQAVNNAREVVRMALNDLNRQIAEKNNLTYYGKLKLPRIKFSNNALTDDEEVRQFVQFLYKHGLLSAEDTLGAFDYDLKRQMRKKEDEVEFEDLIKIPFEPSQGLLDDESQSKSDNGNPNDNSQPRP